MAVESVRLRPRHPRGTSMTATSYRQNAQTFNTISRINTNSYSLIAFHPIANTMLNISDPSMNSVRWKYSNQIKSRQSFFGLRTK